MKIERDRRGRILPPPTYDEANARRPAGAREQETRAVAALRLHHKRFADKHGVDALIAFLKTDLAERGEDRQRLDALAQKLGPGGQTSILNAGK